MGSKELDVEELIAKTNASLATPDAEAELEKIWKASEDRAAELERSERIDPNTLKLVVSESSVHHPPKRLRFCFVSKEPPYPSCMETFQSPAS